MEGNAGKLQIFTIMAINQAFKSFDRSQNKLPDQTHTTQCQPHNWRERERENKISVYALLVLLFFQ